MARARMAHACMPPVAWARWPASTEHTRASTCIGPRLFGSTRAQDTCVCASQHVLELHLLLRLYQVVSGHILTPSEKTSLRAEPEAARAPSPPTVPDRTIPASVSSSSLERRVVQNSAWARFQWAKANRKRVEREKEQKAVHDEQRAAEQTELNQKVALMRSASVGRVEASRQHLLEDNRRHRQEEGRREQFALAEKARRLQALREEHQLMLQASFRTVTEEYETSDFGKLSQRLTLAPGGRVRRAKSAGKRKTTPFTDDAFY